MRSELRSPAGFTSEPHGHSNPIEELLAGGSFFLFVACLKYISNEKMTKHSLRQRFKIDDQNAATASRIIR